MPTSTITIRAADLEADRAGMLRVLDRNLPGAGDARRFDWLYLANPDGPSLAWVAESDDGEIVGTSAAHPRRMRVEGGIVRALVLSDFAFDAGYRSLGPALRLLKATLAPVRAGEFPLSYDFPSEAMHALYKRLGASALGPTARWVRPLRISAAIRRRLGGGPISTAAGAAADAALAARDAFARGARSADIREAMFPLGPEFDAFDEENALLAPIRGIRDSAYLDWKYGGHAMWEHSVLTAHRGGRLAGYLVHRKTDHGTLRLVDLLAPDAPVRRALVARLVRLGRGQGADGIEAEALDASAFSRMLGGLGFVRREQGVGPVAVGGAESVVVTDANCWWINGGDRDI